MIITPLSSSKRLALSTRTRACAAALLLMAVAAQGPAWAQSSPFGGFEHDASQPVEVASDTLEVRNEEQKAVFSGNVRIRQGDVRMKAEWLEVTYAAPGERRRGAAAASGAPGAGGAIDRLRARGEVIITNGNETAKAENADYDVATAEILLTGQVILLQGDNVIKGERLRIDLTRGTARMEGDGTASETTGRVRIQLDPNTGRN